MTIGESQELTFESVYYFLVERYVQFKLALGSVFYDKGQIDIDYYSLRKRRYIHSGVEHFVYQFWNYTMYRPMMTVENNNKISTADNAKKTIYRNTGRVHGTKYRISSNFD